MIKIPLYEFECKKCNHIEELLLSMNKTDVFDWIICPICGEQMNRIISKSSFILKGGGWSDTGYSKKNE